PGGGGAPRAGGGAGLGGAGGGGGGRVRKRSWREVRQDRRRGGTGTPALCSRPRRPGLNETAAHGAGAVTNPRRAAASRRSRAPRRGAASGPARRPAAALACPSTGAAATIRKFSRVRDEGARGSDAARATAGSGRAGVVLTVRNG